jgi:hypothetical protein
MFDHTTHKSKEHSTRLCGWASSLVSSNDWEKGSATKRTITTFRSLPLRVENVAAAQPSRRSPRVFRPRRGRCSPRVSSPRRVRCSARVSRPRRAARPQVSRNSMTSAWNRGRPSVSYSGSVGDRPQQMETGHNGWRPATTDGDRPQQMETGHNRWRPATTEGDRPKLGTDDNLG